MQKTMLTMKEKGPMVKKMMYCWVESEVSRQCRKDSFPKAMMGYLSRCSGTLQRTERLSGREEQCWWARWAAGARQVPRSGRSAWGRQDQCRPGPRMIKTEEQ